MWFCHIELPLIYVSQTQRITVEVFKQKRFCTFGLGSAFFVLQHSLIEEGEELKQNGPIDGKTPNPHFTGSTCQCVLKMKDSDVWKQQQRCNPWCSFIGGVAVRGYDSTSSCQINRSIAEPFLWHHTGHSCSMSRAIPLLFAPCPL